jgi:hypothetical protein
MYGQYLAVAALLLSVQCCCGAHVPGMSGQWAVGLRGDGSTAEELEQRAQSIARQHGLLFKGKVAGVQGVFELATPRSAAVDNSSELTRSLQLDEEVIMMTRVLKRALAVSCCCWCVH